MTTFRFPPRIVRSLVAAIVVAGCTAIAMAQTPPIAKTDEKARTDLKELPLSDIQKAAKAFQEGKFNDEAVKALEAAVKADPKLGTPRLVLSRWMFESRKGSDARTLLEQASAETPRHPEVYMLNAKYALSDGRVTDAILNLDRALELGLDRSWSAEMRKHFGDEARNGLAIAYERRGDWNQVKRYLLEINQDNPDNPQLLQRLARANFLLGQDHEAATNLQAAQAKDPTLDPPELVIAQLWAGKGAGGADAKKIEEDAAKNKAKAEEWFKLAREKYNADQAMARPAGADRERAAKVYRSHAEWLLGQGNLAAAKAQVDTAARLEPDSRETKGVQGLLARYEGKTAEAVRLFEEAWKTSPSYPFALAHLALALSESPDAKDRKRALEFAEQYQKQNTQNPDAFAVLGYCLLKQDPPRLDDAEKALAVPSRAGPFTPDTAYYIACYFNKRGRYDQAAELLEQALEKYPAFIYRSDAKKLLDEVKPKAAKKP